MLSSFDNRRRGVTLIELMVVISVVSFLMVTFGVTLSNYIQNAREAQTLSTLTKVDGLISERLKALERAYRKPNFNAFVNRIRKGIESGDVDNNPGLGPEEFPMPGFSREAAEMLARKTFARLLFPQYLDEAFPFGQPTAFAQILADGTVTFDRSKHTPVTESAELLYFALTRMEVFGVAPIGEDFKSQELKDTDGDGLLEIVDGWGNPIRFYRSPTRLLKPYGAFGPDSLPGIGGLNDDGTGATDGFGEIGYVGSSGPTDDLLIMPEWRKFAALFIGGLPREPYRNPSAAGATLVLYDQLNQDPDDPYGLLLSEFRRLSGNVAKIDPDWLVDTEIGFDHAIAAPNNKLLLWNFATFDVYHKPLVVSSGADGELGILEPFPTNDFDGNGTISPLEDIYGDGAIHEFGHLACPKMVSKPTWKNRVPATSTSILGAAFQQATDNLTNRKLRSGR